MGGKILGLALSAGAARGWAHVGVLRGLEEIGLQPHVIAGCSVGALVGGAWLSGAMESLEAWARTLSPLSALQQFSFGVSSGGFVDAASAFDAFHEYDCAIEDLPARFGCVACNLANGEEVELTTGPLLSAIRASTAIPILMKAIDVDGQWLVDGAIVNPTPVSLARKLGADVVVAVDLNAVPNTLSRFKPPDTTMPVPVPLGMKEKPKHLSDAVTQFINETRDMLSREVAMAKARLNARPHLFETGMAVADTIQMQISRARADSCPPDILLTPDMREARPNAFDRADEFIETGRKALMTQADEILQLMR